MPEIATFVDTTLPTFVAASKALVADGWKKVPNTAGNRRTILLKYYEYLVNTNAKMAGLNVRSLTPAQLEPVWAKATAEYSKYEMYVKNVVHVSAAMNMNDDEAPMPVEESFASVNDVERMQPGYVDIDDLLAGFGKMGLGGGRRRHRTKKYKKSHKKSHKRVKTHRRKSHKRRHTRRH
jgi:hypothetical protein